jgi:hypothetical protein
MKPQGRRIAHAVPVRFPDGTTWHGAIWQHTSGARGLYAVVEREGQTWFVAVQPVWQVWADEHGHSIAQGMRAPFPRNIVHRLRFWLGLLRKMNRSSRSLR